MKDECELRMSGGRFRVSVKANQLQILLTEAYSQTIDANTLKAR